MKSLILVCGVSGSGKSTAGRVFEDAGIRVISNLPPRLLGELAEEAHADKDFPSRIAIFPETRSDNNVTILLEQLECLAKQSFKMKSIFLDASNEILLNRYKESRRPHPFQAGNSLIESIELERASLSPIRSRFQQVLYTDAFDLIEFRKALLQSIETTINRKMAVSFMSFGFKFGIPLEVDLCFDVRFLPNPFFVNAFREMKGSEQPIKEFVLEKVETKQFLEHLLRTLQFLLPLYLKEGKSYLTIGIGCTGGRHRSVVIVDELFKMLQSDDLAITSTHRDINRKILS